MKKIGYLIPEFPGQTHAFFMRERDEIVKRGLVPVIISTRQPIDGAGLAKHSWADKEAANTTYLFPMGVTELLSAFGLIILAGPVSWWTCFKLICTAEGLSLKERSKQFLFWLAGAKLKRLARQFELEHIHIHSCANSAHVGMFSRVIGGPTYSLTLHGPMDDYGKNQLQKWSYAKFCIIITQEIFAEVKERLSSITLPPIFLAPMGVNVEKFKRKNVYLPPTSGEVVRLVSCGRLNYVKAHDDLIRAVALLKDRGTFAKLHICGTVDSASDKRGYASELAELSRELGVENQICFLGSVSEERVREELEACHFFCLASLKEPLGVAIMEGMAMSVPSIVTRSPGTEELIENNENGVLVKARSPEQFADTIIELVKRPELCSQYSEKGREKVVKYFHSGISAERIVEGVNLC